MDSIVEKILDPEIGYTSANKLQKISSITVDT